MTHVLDGSVIHGAMTGTAGHEQTATDLAALGGSRTDSEDAMAHAMLDMEVVVVMVVRMRDVPHPRGRA